MILNLQATTEYQIKLFTMVSHVLIPVIELLVQFDLFALVPIRPPKKVTESHEALFAGEHARASPPCL